MPKHRTYFSGCILPSLHTYVLAATAAAFQLMAAEPESVIFLYDTAEERKNIVAKLHREGLSQTSIASHIRKRGSDTSVHRSTVVRDCSDLGLKTWSDIAIHQLETIISELFGTEHDAVGYQKIESHLLDVHGLRVQEDRIKEALVGDQIFMVIKPYRFSFSFTLFDAFY